MAKGSTSQSSSSQPSASTPAPSPILTSFQTFLFIVSCVAGQICVGSIFIFNFYVTYLVSYIRFRGCNYNMDYKDGSIVLLFISSGFGLFGYPAGCLATAMPVRHSLAVGSCFFLTSLLFVFLGAHYQYGLLLAAFLLLGASACLIQISLLLGCLRHFQGHRGIITGALFGVVFGAPSVLYMWEISFVNPKNLPPVTLLEGEIEESFFDRIEVLDRCATFFIMFCVMCAIMLILPMVMFIIFPPPTVERDDEFTLGCHRTCLSEFCGFCIDIRFLLAFFSIGFSGVAGLCARSTLKSYGVTFLQNQHHLSKIGGSGSLACSIGSLTMGIIVDLSTEGGLKLLILNCLLNFIGSLMLMYARQMGSIWYLLSYDLTLFAYGGSNAILTLVLLQICGLRKFPVAFGVTSLVNFFSAIWYFLSVVSQLPYRDFWLASVMFAFMGVVSSIALQLKVDTRELQQDSIMDPSECEDEQMEFIMHNGKRYYRFTD